MSLSVTLKKNISPNNKVIKEFSGSTLTLDCVLKEPVNFNLPEFIISSSEMLSEYNYFEFNGKQYFRKDVKSVGNDLWEISGKIDRLSTWSNAILECDAIINKQQGLNHVNKYLNDGSFVSQVNEFNTSYNFPNGFNDSSVYILICAGG